MTAPADSNLPERVAVNLRQRLEDLHEQLSVAAAEPDEGPPRPPGDASAELRADQGLLEAHRQTSPLTSAGMALSDACGQRQPCSHVRALAKKYLPPGSFADSGTGSS